MGSRTARTPIAVYVVQDAMCRYGVVLSSLAQPHALRSGQPSQHAVATHILSQQP